MSMSDPIADFIIQIKNGYLARKKQVSIPSSRMKEALATVLSRHGYVGDVNVENKKASHKTIVMSLVYEGKKGKLTDIVRVSKPGRRVYVTHDKIRKVLEGFGCKILSTPAGLMTDKEARKKGVGGEVICKLW